MDSLESDQPIYCQVQIENCKTIKQVDYINMIKILDGLNKNQQDQMLNSIGNNSEYLKPKNQFKDISNYTPQDENKYLVISQVDNHFNINHLNQDYKQYDQNNGYYQEQNNQIISKHQAGEYNLEIQNNEPNTYLTNSNQTSNHHQLYINQQSSQNQNIQFDNHNNQFLNETIFSESSDFISQSEIIEASDKSFYFDQLQLAKNILQKVENKEKFLQINQGNEGIFNPVIIDCDQDQDQSLLIYNCNNICQKNQSKYDVLKVKKGIKNRNEKMKPKEYSIISRQRQRQYKDKDELNEQKKRIYSNLTLFQSISNNIQFFVFCDIYIEQKQIMSTQMEQSKKSDTNYFKQVQQVIEYKNNNLFEIVVSQSLETQMEFENCQNYLLGLQNQYAKQISDSLKCLQEKSRLAQESIQLIQKNRAVYEYILKRKQSSEQAYNKFKMEILPQHKYYFYMRYTYNLTNGNFQISDIGYSKDFVNIIAINSEYLKQKMSQFGIIEFFKRGQKTAFKINYFSQFLFNMQSMPNVIRFILDFITLDNIELKFNVEQQLINLCKEFDKENNFDCPFIDFVMLSLPILPDDIEQNLLQIRKQQNINTETLLQMDQEEVDFYYNQESQQFLKRYYSDIYHKNLNSHDLSNQKVDYSHIL